MSDVTSARSWTEAEARNALRQIFDAAVASAEPGAAVLRHLPHKPKGRCVVVGAGKAAAAMAAAVDAAWPDVDLSGVVVTRHGQGGSAGRIKVLEAAHPTPDAGSEQAARNILAAVQGLGPDDLVIALISGGGSALMVLPGGTMTLAEKQSVNKSLLASGATIVEMNAVRKHLSAIKGGRLALAAHPARVVTLAISDIPGDDPAAIASGPTVADPSTLAEVRDIIARYQLDLPASALAILDAGTETPKALDANNSVRIIAAPSLALAAAADAATKAGLTPLILGDAIEGESRELGIVMAGIARSVRLHGHPVKAPAVLLSGGETTVTIGKGPAGRGGRNTEFLLGFAIAMAGEADVFALAGDSDGIDGTEDAAGAIVTPDTLSRARAAGLDPRGVLAAHDSYGLFDAIGDLVRTGPTGTNVNDIRAVLIGRGAPSAD
ncbi:hydroxypyruvate reductase [Rhodopseudomonas rhenobacensis]|uniref:Hydroxypyruvate reductase n=1 Tax=Rhodopseudomonas rhenobacensis TaxID=87461 RepID=A0A7W8DXF3_9BRAD|nr:glycerate kinase [Rhodopseudomonas rhenobacensis]MBB5046174.1 hydroxypyruvate reductase [Rhodopseudomonas rhenobacensis]